MRFRYQRYRTRLAITLTGGFVARPEIAVKVVGPAGAVKVDALVDTGSDITLFPRSLATLIGAAVDDSVRWSIGGFAGQVIEASPGVVKLEISDGISSHHWRTTVAFVSYPDGAERLAILGHRGFFDHLRVTFDGPAQELEIQPAPDSGTPVRVPRG
jgi:predicted aspartyl protease